MMNTRPCTAPHLLGCQAALFEWAESYDSKDWDRLSKCIAPTLYIDYRLFVGKLWEAMPAADFVHMVSDQRFLGNALIKTQHNIGASRWSQTAEGEVTGRHQMRVAHQKYADGTMKEVAHKGHGHGSATTWFRKVDGVWKFAGIQPEVRWNEFEMESIFGP
ncbi:hypothetical protein E4U41_004638 [Claviceps citrina]|nr:hypothetical protein E4U41_004638 [Claviceps citrina]